MTGKRRVVGINGSASQHSANLAILKWIGTFGEPDFDLQILNPLSDLPHFQPERTENDVPERIIEFRTGQFVPGMLHPAFTRYCPKPGSPEVARREISPACAFCRLFWSSLF